MKCCNNKFAMLMILIALALGFTVTLWPTARMHEIVAITRFFEVMLPVLAVSALIKYLGDTKS